MMRAASNAHFGITTASLKATQETISSSSSFIRPSVQPACLCFNEDSVKPAPGLTQRVVLPAGLVDGSSTTCNTTKKLLARATRHRHGVFLFLNQICGAAQTLSLFTPATDAFVLRTSFLLARLLCSWVVDVLQVVVEGSGLGRYAKLWASSPCGPELHPLI